jgi:hypothetical protein
VGAAGILEYVEEDRVEVVVNDDGHCEGIKGAVATLKSVSTREPGTGRATEQTSAQIHPYEEVAYDVYRLEDI